MNLPTPLIHVDSKNVSEWNELTTTQHFLSSVVSSVCVWHIYQNYSTNFSCGSSQLIETLTQRPACRILRTRVPWNARRVRHGQRRNKRVTAVGGLNSIYVVLYVNTFNRGICSHSLGRFITVTLHSFMKGTSDVFWKIRCHKTDRFVVYFLT